MDLNDDSLLAAFEGGHLAPGGFHHRDHVRVAWIFLERYPAAEALDRFSSGLRRFATAQGKPDLYHETITWALMLAINQGRATLPADHGFAEFAAANDELLRWPSPLLERSYRRETLASNTARQVFVLPDRLADQP